jgi:hypothetical protein
MATTLEEKKAREQVSFNSLINYKTNRISQSYKFDIELSDSEASEDYDGDAFF